MKIRVIKIDAENQTIYPIVIDNDLGEISKAIGCNLLDSIQLNDTEYIYIDDIGLQKRINYGFQVKAKYGSLTLAGNGIVVAYNEEGEYIHATSIVAQIDKLIDFGNFNY